MANEIAMEKGSNAWGKSVRKRARELAHNVTMDYVELATILWEIHDTPINGDRSNPAIYTEWGFNKLSDFAKEELGLEPRKANYLCGIGNVIKVELGNSDPHWLNRFLELGWTKVREISRVLKAHQLKEWVLQAEQATFKEIEAMVAVYRQNEEKALQDRETAAGGYTISKDPFAPPKTDIQETDALDGADVSIAVSGADYDSNPAGLPETPTVKISAPIIDVPIPEKLTSEVFSLYEKQLEDVKKALKKAGELSGSSKKSHNLALICADFIAQNDFSSGGEEQKIKFIAKIENLLGYKLVAANPDDYSVAYGFENLKKMASHQVLQQQVVEVVACSR